MEFVQSPHPFGDDDFDLKLLSIIYTNPSIMQFCLR